ncbi:MAG: CHAT domain-containing protein [Aureispira sp.]|nr:CHAT domain-containing protein [Aureispira sp.]
MGRFQEAIPPLLQAMAIMEEAEATNSPSYSSSNTNLAGAYWRLGKYEETEHLLVRAIEITKNTLGEEHPEYAQNLSNLGALYYTMERYEATEPLFLQALEIRKKVLGEQHVAYGNSLNNLAGLYQDLERYKESEAYYIETIKVLKVALGEDHPYYAISLEGLAMLYTNTKRYAESEPLMLEVQQIRKSALGEHNPEYAEVLLKLGIVYTGLEQFEKAEQFYAQSGFLLENTLGKYHQLYFNYLNNFSELYNAKGDFETTTSKLYQALTLNCVDNEISFPKNSLDDIPTYKFRSETDLLETLRALSTAAQKQYMQDKKANREALLVAYSATQASIKIKNRINSEFTQHNDKLTNLKVIGGMLATAIQIELELASEKDEATVRKTFQYAEQNKSILLTEATKAKNRQTFGQLPDSIAKKEAMLQLQFSQLKKEELETADPTKRMEVTNVLNQLSIEIEAFRKELKETNPKYYELKYNTTTKQLKDIQDELSSKTALLEYFVADEFIYLFSVQKEKANLYTLKINKDSLNSKVRALRNTLTNYNYIRDYPEKAYRNYTQNAYWFYENLLAPALEDIQNVEELIIVADGALGHVPFEAFLTQKPSEQYTNYRLLDYLIKDYKVSYNYSASLWHANKTNPKSSNNGKVLACAGSYQNKNLTKGRSSYLRHFRDRLVELPAARKEIEVLSTQFDGTFLQDTSSNEHFFKQHAEDYSIIHLAMHGTLDKQNPILSSLVFTENGDTLEDNFLQAYEISHMNLNADLVVLSACETGYGKFAQGEGVMSMARAFMYAGVSSVVVSLWQVNDLSTSEIMQEFYRNLAKGQDKAAALQAAKIYYLDIATGIAAHPAFWSPFVQLGDSQSIESITKKGDSNWIWWLIGGLAGLGLVAVLLKSLRRKEVV